MNLYERYVSGDTITVYAEIASLREEAFNAVYYGDVVAVLEETFKRTSYNLSVIYEALLRDNYHFKKQIEYSFDHPLLKPLPNVEELLNTLDEAVKPFGFVPLSIKTFYRVVGSCNFAWDYTTNKNFRWNMADPIQVVSLDDVVTSVTDKYWHDDIRNYVEDENFGCAFLELSADDLHKDNVSGGAPYKSQNAHRSIAIFSMSPTIRHLSITFGFVWNIVVFLGWETQDITTTIKIFSITSNHNSRLSKNKLSATYGM